MTVFGSKGRDVLDVYDPVDRQYPKPITELDRYNERALRAAMSAAEIDDEKIDMILDDASVDVGCSQLTPSGLHVHGPVNVYWALLFILETYYSTRHLGAVALFLLDTQPPTSELYQQARRVTDENFLRSRRHHPKRLAWPARALPPVPGGGKGISCTWSKEREERYYRAVTEYVQSEYLRTREHPVS